MRWSTPPSRIPPTPRDATASGAAYPDAAWTGSMPVPEHRRDAKENHEQHTEAEGDAVQHHSTVRRRGLLSRDPSDRGDARGAPSGSVINRTFADECDDSSGWIGAHAARRAATTLDRRRRRNDSDGSPARPRT